MEKIESLWNNILFFKQSNRKCKNISFPPIYFHNNYNLSHRFLSISHSTHVQAGIQYPHRFRLSIDLYIYIYFFIFHHPRWSPTIRNELYLYIIIRIFISYSSDSLSFHVTRTQRTNSFPPPPPSCSSNVAPSQNSTCYRHVSLFREQK